MPLWLGVVQHLSLWCHSGWALYNTPHSDVTLMPHWCHSDATLMSLWCHSDATLAGRCTTPLTLMPLWFDLITITGQYAYIIHCLPDGCWLYNSQVGSSWIHPLVTLDVLSLLLAYQLSLSGCGIGSRELEGHSLLCVCSWKKGKREGRGSTRISGMFTGLRAGERKSELSDEPICLSSIEDAKSQESQLRTRNNKRCRLIPRRSESCITHKKSFRHGYATHPKRTITLHIIANRQVSLYVFRPWTTHVVQATLFVGLDGLAVRCSFTKNGLATNRLAESTHARCRFRTLSECFHIFVAWVVRTDTGTKLLKSTRNAQKCSVFRTTPKAHCQNGSRTWFKIEPRSLCPSMVWCSLFRAETRTAKAL